MTDGSVITGPYETDVPRLRELVHQMTSIEPAATTLWDLGEFVFDRMPVGLGIQLSRAIAGPNSRLSDRVLLSRFVIRFSLNGFEISEQLVFQAEAAMIMLGLAERAVSYAQFNSGGYVQLESAILRGQPIGLRHWLAFVVIRDLATRLGEDHRLISVAQRSLLLAEQPV